MSLSDRLTNAPQTPGRPDRCSVCIWLDGLSEQDRDSFDAWIESGLSAAPLHEACRAEGLTVKLTTFRHHLRTCNRDAV